METGTRKERQAKKRWLKKAVKDLLVKRYHNVRRKRLRWWKWGMGYYENKFLWKCGKRTLQNSGS